MAVRRLIVLCVVACALLLPVPVLAASGTPVVTSGSATPGATPATGPGSITGTIKNGTPNGGSVDGLTVTLTRFNGTTQIQSWQTKIGSDGKYSFDHLPVNSGEAYIASTTYKKIQFQTDLIVLTQNQHSNGDFDVYEPTTDPNVIKVNSRGLVISGVEQGVSQIDVYEIVSLENTSKKVYVGSNNTVLTIPIPPGSSQVIPQAGFDFGQTRLVGNNFITTGPINPGSQDAEFAYTVNYSGTKAILDIGTSMPTGSLSVLIKKGSYKISSPSLQDAGTVDLSGSTFNVLSINNPVIGDIVRVTVAGLPKGGASTSDSNRGPIYAALAAAAGLLVAGGLIFQIVRRRRLVPAGGPAGAAVTLPEPGTKEDERLTLAAELNKLDDDHAVGRIDDETYQRERQEILDELRDISREMHGVESEVD